MSPPEPGGRSEAGAPDGACDPAAADRIRTNLERVRGRMTAACEAAGRDPGEVRLLLATKTVEPERIRVGTGLATRGIRKRRGADPAASFLQGVEGRLLYRPRRMMASWISM